MTALEQLIQEIKTVAKLQGVTAVLHWDQETNMPAGGGEARADQIALLESLAHEKLIGESISKPLGNLVDMGSGEPDPNLDAEEQRLVREIWKDYHRASVLPTKFVEELAKTTSRAQQVWADARRKKRFEDFAPILEKLVALKFKEIGYRGQKDTPYDTLLDEFEPGMTSAIISTLFEEMKARLVPLVQKISKSSVDTGVAIWATFRSIWMMFFPNTAFQSAITLKNPTYPGLYSIIDDVCRRVKTKKPTAIILLAEPNFFVMKGKLATFDGVVKGRILALGMPLLKELNSLEISSILAHEFAHFSGRDTLYSVIVSPVYRGIISSMESLGAVNEESGDSRSAQLFLFWFGSDL